MSRAKRSHRCLARASTDVVAADAFVGERFRPRATGSRGIGSDSRTDVARDGRRFRGADLRPATGPHIGRSPLERLLDTGSDLIRGNSTAAGASHADWDLSN